MSRSPLLLGAMLLLALCAASCLDGDDAGGSEKGRGDTIGGVTGARKAAEPPGVRLTRDLDSLSFTGGHHSRVAHTEGNRWAVEYIAAGFRAAGAMTRLDTIARTELVNVVATIAGRSDSVLVIGAHLDASASRDRGWKRGWASMKAPGAVDNASGVAALLEIARAVARQDTPRYTLELVAFNAEEYSPRHRGHHLGSLHYAAALKRSRRPFRGAIVLDMVASTGRRDRVELFANRSSRGLAQEITAAHGSSDSTVELALARNPCSRSDNESFDRLGMPAVLFMESCAPWKSSAGYDRYRSYHSAADTPEKVNRRVLVEVVRTIIAFVTGGSA